MTNLIKLIIKKLMINGRCMDIAIYNKEIF